MGRWPRNLHRALVLLALFALPQPALADNPIIVGNGTGASCTETALKDALMIAETIGGATIRFKCGPAPVTIALSQVTEIDALLVHLVLPNNTTIDGGGLITLDGTADATVAFVDHDTTAALQGLSIVGDGLKTGPAGGIVNSGRLTFRRSTVSHILGLLTGGISNDGTLTIVDSTISGNFGVFLTGGVTNGGTLSVKHSTIAHNGTSGGAGGILNLDTLTVDNSTFSDNSNAESPGGGIVNGGTLAVNHSTFSGNSANSGGGIFNGGTLTINNSTFSHNSAGSIGGGGGIFNDGTLTVTDSTFSGNVAASGGGIFTYPDSFASVKDSRLFENGAPQGGGIFNGGTLKIVDSTLSGNTGFWGGGIFNAATLTLKGSTITNNTASFGGGIYICVEGQVTPVRLSLFGQLPCHDNLGLRDTTVTKNTPDDIFP